MEKNNYQDDIGKVIAAAFSWKSRAEKSESECDELRIKLDALKRYARLVVDNALVHTRQDVLEAKQYILEVTNGDHVGNPHPDGCFRTDGHGDCRGRKEDEIMNIEIDERKIPKKSPKNENNNHQRVTMFCDTCTEEVSANWNFDCGAHICPICGDMVTKESDTGHTSGK